MLNFHKFVCPHMDGTSAASNKNSENLFLLFLHSEDNLWYFLQFC